MNINGPIYEKAVSDGAFRLWHLLFDKAEKNGSVSITFEEIAQFLGSKNQGSIAKWLDQLENTGWLQVAKTKGRKSKYYPIVVVT